VQRLISIDLESGCVRQPPKQKEGKPMSANAISRILGLIIFAIIGWLIGTIWAGTAQLTAESLQKILPLLAGSSAR
jgi:hypothetical protein